MRLASERRRFLPNGKDIAQDIKNRRDSTRGSSTIIPGTKDRTRSAKGKNEGEKGKEKGRINEIRAENFAHPRNNAY